MRSALALVVLLELLSPARAFSQTEGDGGPEAAKIKVRFGPVLMNPTLTIGNIGVDGNVFNSATDPKSDFTMTVSPKAEIWTRVMGSWFTGLVAEDLVWYQEYASERYDNNTLGLDWKLPLSSTTVTLGTRRIRTHDRPGYEIDERAARVLLAYSGAVLFRVRSNTAINVSARRDETDFDDASTFDGVNLSQALDRRTTSIALEVNQKLTPLTTLVAGASGQRDRFRSDPLRDADVTRASVGMRFDSRALLNGGFMVSATRFAPLSSDLPDYDGPTYSADVSYVLLDRAKFTFKAERSIEYSYEADQPYYVQRDLRLDISEHLAGPVDFALRGGVAYLDYRDQVGVPVPVPDRSDRVASYGGGVTYRIGRNLRLGFSADQNRRTSAIDSRRYTRPTYGATVTWGV